MALAGPTGCCLQPGAEPNAEIPEVGPPAIRFDAGTPAVGGDAGTPWISCDAPGGCPVGLYCDSAWRIASCPGTALFVGHAGFASPFCADDCSDGSCHCTTDGDCPPPLRCGQGVCGLVVCPAVGYCPDSCSVALGPQGCSYCLCPDTCPTLCLADRDCPSGDYCELTYGPCLDGGVAGVCHRDCTQGDRCNPAGCDATESCGCGADYECPPNGSCAVVLNPDVPPSSQCQAIDAGPCPDVA